MQADRLFFDPHEVAARRHVADLEPFGHGAAVDHAYPIEQDATGRGGHRTQLGIAEPGLAGVSTEQEVEIQRFDRLFRVNDNFLALPVVRAGPEAGHLAPEFGPIVVDQVEIERVIRADRPGYPLRLAPCRCDDRLGLLLVQHDAAA